jgi:hypothetical protein
MFFVIKDEERRMAKNGLIRRILVTVISFVVSFFVPFPYSLIVIIAVVIGLTFYYMRR